MPWIDHIQQPGRLAGDQATIAIYNFPASRDLLELLEVAY